MDGNAVLTGRREIAVERVLFQLMDCVRWRQRGLRAFLSGSLDHLGDNTDDEAAREIPSRMVSGARRKAGK